MIHFVRLGGKAKIILITRTRKGDFDLNREYDLQPKLHDSQNSVDLITIIFGLHKQFIDTASL